MAVVSAVVSAFGGLPIMAGPSTHETGVPQCKTSHTTGTRHDRCARVQFVSYMIFSIHVRMVPSVGPLDRFRSVGVWPLGPLVKTVLKNEQDGSGKGRVPSPWGMGQSPTIFPENGGA